MSRPDWDTYFSMIAKVVATRAACTRSQVGAVLVQDNRIVGSGYNGSPSGQLECTEGGCPRGLLSASEVPPGTEYSNCVAVHAEVNALAYAASEARGGTLYVTREPCDWCSKTIAAFGIERVVVGG